LVDDGEMGCKGIVTCSGNKREKVTLIEGRKGEEEGGDREVFVVFGSLEMRATLDEIGETESVL